mmetsp:Transcript_47338/g.148337  ORF Transcript_47338/g.148337 Transcript_47338/m.148337 type:complete len:310 (-) Transcript_47338:249-1178(-)
MLPVAAKVARNEGQLGHISPRQKGLCAQHRVLEGAPDLGVVREVELPPGGGRGDGSPEGAAAEGPQWAATVEGEHGDYAVDGDIQHQAQHGQIPSPLAAKAHEKQRQQGTGKGSCDGTPAPGPQEDDSAGCPVEVRVGQNSGRRGSCRSPQAAEGDARPCGHQEAAHQRHESLQEDVAPDGEDHASGGATQRVPEHSQTVHRVVASPRPATEAVRAEEAEGHAKEHLGSFKTEVRGYRHGNSDLNDYDGPGDLVARQLHRPDLEVGDGRCYNSSHYGVQRSVQEGTVPGRGQAERHGRHGDARLVRAGV